MNKSWECRYCQEQDGSSALIWQPVHAYGISGQMPMTIFGKPIIFTEKVPALGITGDITLADLSQYAVGLRQEVILERSNAPGWTRDVESFRCIVRADGQALWDREITPANGSNTLSWCVTLSSSM